MAQKAMKSGVARAPRTVLSFFSEARDELKKVSWPSREATIRYTVVVIIASLVTGAAIGGFDFILTQALERFLF